MSISIVIPCRNEKATIGKCIKEIKQTCKKNKYNYEIIVSDSSTDGSEKIAKKQGAKIIKHNKIGYGNALQEGFKHAKGKLIVFADGDGTYDFKEIPKFINAIKNYDIVIGNRFNKKMKKGAMPWLHKHIGNPLLSILLKLFFKKGPKDAHCGFRAIKKNKLKKLKLKTTGMEFASEMIIKAIKNNFKINEIDIAYDKRQGISKLQTFRDGWKHLRFMLLYSPNYLFFTPGIISICIGLLGLTTCNIYACKLIWHIASSLLIIFGYEILLLGLFSKIYAINYLKEEDRVIKKLLGQLSIDKGIILGSTIFVFGLVVFLLLFIKGNLNINIGLIALIFATLGIQTVFATFFMSILGIQEA